jgi:ParB-like chromosome segregation protein Spo0J
MIDMTTLIDPEEIKPLHAVTFPRHFDELVADMRENGWRGNRPLLVIERADGSIVAWTGSHRIAAAIEVGFSTVPCYVLDESELLDHGYDATSGVEDYHRLEILRKVGDETAILLMWQEGRH